ncbi:MAG TPA: hypothetical protein VNC78_06985 [Actinomycetota bacterium]|nr:hypothetical protein [Actinomycetota bacterium]
MNRNSIRSLSGLAAVALLLGALAVPATAKPSKGCPKFKPGVAPASEAQVLKVTDKATVDKPLVVNFTHATALPLPDMEPLPVTEERLYYNIQLVTKSHAPGLFILEEFEDVSDIDLYLYDASGTEVASSAVFNPVPQGPLGGPTGGNGYESVPGLDSTPCAGYTIESRAVLTEGSAATLKIWLEGSHH